MQRRREFVPSPSRSQSPARMDRLERRVLMSGTTLLGTLGITPIADQDALVVTTSNRDVEGRPNYNSNDRETYGFIIPGNSTIPVEMKAEGLTASADTNDDGTPVMRCQLNVFADTNGNGDVDGAESFQNPVYTDADIRSGETYKAVTDLAPGAYVAEFKSLAGFQGPINGADSPFIDYRLIISRVVAGSTPPPEPSFKLTDVNAATGKGTLVVDPPANTNFDDFMVAETEGNNVLVHYAKALYNADGGFDNPGSRGPGEQGFPLESRVLFPLSKVSQVKLSGGEGRDTISISSALSIQGFALGGAGDDQLVGGSGNDTLVGESGRDVLDGGDGNDTIDGGPDDDTINGGDGIDVLTGGGGNDTFSNGETVSAASLESVVFAGGRGTGAATPFNVTVGVDKSGQQGAAPSTRAAALLDLARGA